jgi:hypothetical protein
MLSQIVRPLVDTQVRLLANSQATEKTFAQIIASWLGYLGVHTEVTQLIPNSDRICVSLTVGKPESCAQKDWQKILNNLANSQIETPSVQSEEMEMAKLIQLSKLLAYIIQTGSPETEPDWAILEQQLGNLNLDSITLQAVQSALKVPQILSSVEKIDPDIAARAFPLAVKIAWMDDKVTTQESEALKTLLSLIAPDLKI